MPLPDSFDTGRGAGSTVETMAQLLDSGQESLATQTIRTEAARYHFREHAFEPFSNGSTVRSSLWTTKMKSRPSF